MSVIIAYLAILFLIYLYLKKINKDGSTYTYCILYQRNAQRFFLVLTLIYMFFVPVLNELIFDSNAIVRCLLLLISSLPMAIFYIHTKSFFVKISDNFVVARRWNSIVTTEFSSVRELVIVKDGNSYRSKRIVLVLLDNHELVISVSSDFQYMLKYGSTIPIKSEEIVNYVESRFSVFGITPKYVYEEDNTCGGA